MINIFHKGFVVLFTISIFGEIILLKVLKNIFALILLVGASINSIAQSYYANGDAKSIGGTCYQLTDSKDWQLGSVWYADKLNLSNDFDLELEQFQKDQDTIQAKKKTRKPRTKKIDL